MMTEEHLKALCLLSGLPCDRHWAIMNGYWGKNDIAGPWWLVKTSAGMIRIGWRKRVIEIDWSDTGRRLPELTKDDVTKEATLVHAWSHGKAVEYLSVLWRELQRPPASESDHK